MKMMHQRMELEQNHQRMALKQNHQRMELEKNHQRMELKKDLDWIVNHCDDQLKPMAYQNWRQWQIWKVLKQPEEEQDCWVLGQTARERNDAL